MSVGSSRSSIMSNGRRLLSIELASRLLRDGCVSVWELNRYCYELAQWGDEACDLNIMQDVMEESELKRVCDESQRRLDDSDGGPRSLLEGIPMTIKANMAHQHLPLTAGSNILHTPHHHHHHPTAGYTSDITSFFTNTAGAICLGSTTMDEFGMGSYGTHSSKPTLNPLYLLPPNNNNNNDDDGMEDVEWWTRRILQREYGSMNSGGGERRVVGGSSSGAAASVALGSSLLSLGTDTGGSIRLPAAWTQTIGMKPTYGRLSRHGIVSYASSLDTVGFIAPTISCAQHAYQTLHTLHYTPQHDPTSLLSPPNSTTTTTNTTNTEDTIIRIGIPSALVLQECPSIIMDAWKHLLQRLQKQSTTCTSTNTNNNNVTIQLILLDEDVLSPVLIQHSLAAYYILACAEASSNLSRYDGLRYGPSNHHHNHNNNSSSSSSSSSLEEQYSQFRGEHLGMEVVRRILCGTSVLSSDRFHTHYEAATQLRALLCQQFHTTFTKHNIHALIFPTTLQPHPPTIQDLPNIHPMLCDVMTIPPSLAGLPTLSLPYQTIGMQLVGPKFSESFLLHLAQHHILPQPQ